MPWYNGRYIMGNELPVPLRSDPPFDAEGMACILLTLKDCSGPQAELTRCLGIDIVAEACVKEMKRRHYDSRLFRE